MARSGDQRQPQLTGGRRHGNQGDVVPLFFHQLQSGGVIKLSLKRISQW